ncbi:hypothetical protein MAR_013656 [Mya arenaria]|uniref:C3H1-type domain-containing protein n=1 Tax=Mya arenaria TaxID=6604 RepID=A0ABY7G0I8_MYAAR|nr:hypothetical protein MAR_013656 [Mya arenaria]
MDIIEKIFGTSGLTIEQTDEDTHEYRLAEIKKAIAEHDAQAGEKKLLPYFTDKMYPLLKQHARPNGAVFRITQILRMINNLLSENKNNVENGSILGSYGIGESRDRDGRERDWEHERHRDIDRPRELDTDLEEGEYDRRDLIENDYNRDLRESELDRRERELERIRELEEIKREHERERELEEEEREHEIIRQLKEKERELEIIRDLEERERMKEMDDYREREVHDLERRSIHSRGDEGNWEEYEKYEKVSDAGMSNKGNKDDEELDNVSSCGSHESDYRAIEFSGPAPVPENIAVPIGMNDPLVFNRPLGKTEAYKEEFISEIIRILIEEQEDSDDEDEKESKKLVKIKANYFVIGECKFEENCKRSHDLFSGQTSETLKKYNIDTDVFDRYEILELLRKSSDAPIAIPQKEEERNYEVIENKDADHHVKQTSAYKEAIKKAQERMLIEKDDVEEQGNVEEMGSYEPMNIEAATAKSILKNKIAKHVESEKQLFQSCNIEDVIKHIMEEKKVDLTKNQDRCYGEEGHSGANIGDWESGHESDEGEEAETKKSIKQGTRLTGLSSSLNVRSYASMKYIRVCKWKRDTQK